MFRKPVALVALVAAVCLIAGPASADANRLTVFGPNFEWACDFSSSLGPQTATGSYAVLQYDQSQNSVGATTQLRGLAPNTAYEIRLIQGNSDCNTVNGTITTNRQGNGTLHVAEPSTSTEAAVFIWDTAHTGPFYESDIFHHA